MAWTGERRRTGEDVFCQKKLPISVMCPAFQAQIKVIFSSLSPRYPVEK